MRPNIADEYINFITQEALFPALTIEELQSAVTNDRQLRAVRAALKTNMWESDLVKPFRKIREEITVDHKTNILLRGARVIIPAGLQNHVIKLAHEGNQGLAKTKALMREYLWFPDIDKSVKEEVSTCIACQATGQQNQQLIINIKIINISVDTNPRRTMARIENRLLWTTTRRSASFGCHRYVLAISRGRACNHYFRKSNNSEA